MQNYFFDEERLPEGYDREEVLTLLRLNKVSVYRLGEAPHGKHVGSAAWHDDVTALITGNLKAVDNQPIDTGATMSIVDNGAHSYTEGVGVVFDVAQIPKGVTIEEFAEQLLNKQPEVQNTGGAATVIHVPSPTDEGNFVEPADFWTDAADVEVLEPQTDTDLIPPPTDDDKFIKIGDDGNDDGEGDE